MALPSRPLDELQHRMWHWSQENGNLVFSRQHLSGVEVNRIASLDSRKTFVTSSCQLDSLIAPCIVAGSGKSVIWFVDYLWFVPEVTYVFYQFHSDPRY